MASSATVEAAGNSAAEVGRVFQSAGIDGLILYALLFAPVLLFVALLLVMWLQSRERVGWTKAVELIAEAGKEQADANRELATAIASVNSADQAFKAAMFSLYPELEKRIQEAEAKRHNAP